MREQSLWLSPERYLPGHELCLNDAIAFSQVRVGEWSGTEDWGARSKKPSEGWPTLLLENLALPRMLCKTGDEGIF